MEGIRIKSQKKRCPRRRCCHYRRQKIHSKGAILIVFWTALTSAFYWLNHFTLYRANIIQYILKGSLYLSFPITGWIADTWFGRYKVIKTGLFISLGGALLNTVTIGLSSYFPSGTIQEILLLVGLLPVNVGYCCVAANIIQFATDQMIEIGASGEQLSALIHWQYWAITLGDFTQELPSFIHLPRIPLLIAKAFIPLTCLFSVVLSYCFFRKWLTTTPMIANTLKSVYSVLNYARKTNYPRKRSALTYLDEEHPSRVDYGKDKFGGPFTEEEVEDVKTVLRMLPLFVCMLASGIANDEWSFLLSHLQPSNASEFLITTIPYMVGILIPPLYQLVLYPLFYNAIPTMLQRSGMGLLFNMISVSSYLVLDTIGHVMNPSTGCMIESSSKIPLSREWFCIPAIFHGMAMCILEMSFLEFVIAQTPAKMKGLMVGLWYIFRGTGNCISLVLPFAFPYLSNFPPSCGFYLLLTKLMMLVLVFMIFLKVSTWYKLRQREIIVNIRAIVENHWEKYMDQREEYERLFGTHDSMSCSYGSTDTTSTK